MEKTRWWSIILEKSKNAADLNSQTDGNVNHFGKIGKCCGLENYETVGNVNHFGKNGKCCV